MYFALQRIAGGSAAWPMPHFWNGKFSELDYKPLFINIILESKTPSSLHFRPTGRFYRRRESNYAFRSMFKEATFLSPWSPEAKS